MTAGDLYRAKAVDMAARARADTTRAGKAEYARLSLGYLRLAEEADKKIKTKILDETMPAITQQVRIRRLLLRLLAHVQHAQNGNREKAVVGDRRARSNARTVLIGSSER